MIKYKTSQLQIFHQKKTKKHRSNISYIHNIFYQYVNLTHLHSTTLPAHVID